MDNIDFYYFAYGSNLPYLRMLERTSKDLKLRGKYAWTGRRFVFTKRSTDESGKCTVIATIDDHLVWGAIYQLTPADKRKLAAFERVPRFISVRTRGTVAPQCIATSRQFLTAFVADLGALMSGGISIPFVVYATFWADADQKRSFYVLAFLCLSLAAYRVWNREHQRVKQLQERLEESENQKAQTVTAVQRKAPPGSISEGDYLPAPLTMRNLFDTDFATGVSQAKLI
jgi:hypothetical protein